MPNRFGMGWNVSDILGGLGDAISVGAGGNANYLNQLQKDRYGTGMQDLLAGDTSQGMQTMISALGPEQANEAYNNLRTRDAQDRQVDSTVARNAVLSKGTESEILGREKELEAQNRARYLGLIRTATPQNYEKVVGLANRVAQQNGYTPDFDVPVVFTEGWADNMTRADLSPKEWASDAESRRYHDLSNTTRNRDIGIDATLGAGRLYQEGLRTDEDKRSNLAREAQAATAAEQRANAATNALFSRIMQDVRKTSPNAKFQGNNATGKLRYSLDGGKSWRAAN